ncbi:tyrosine-type recombinase/integrase [Streptosporangium sp. OZ121]|uniref:tyrosine-type recombinase/integrase n=1 Tax=Streptosporangium sp. OZ121 TaxID=3444183 RepID=UPI003F7A727A
MPLELVLTELGGMRTPVEYEMLYPTRQRHEGEHPPQHRRAIKAGIPTTRENGFHMLRHHFASVLLERGVSIKAVADFLGHADPGFTLRTYTHLMPSSEDRMRQVIEDVWATGRCALDVP